MLKSLNDIRVLMIFVLSVVLAFGAKLIDAGYTFFIAFIVAFTFCFGLMEISALLVNKVDKKSFVNFLIFWLLFLVLGYFFCSALGLLLNFNTLATVQIQICFCSAILIIGLFQTVNYWLIKNHHESSLLLNQKQVYLQHSFNALTSQNVIEFLQEALINTVELIKKDPNLAVFQIEKLTSILRHLLQSRGQRYVKLGAELNNAKEYCELVEIQLNIKVNLNISITDEFNNTNIPPLVFQMVLDNRFKNFAGSSEKELDIQVYIENKKFVVVKTSLSSSEKNSFKNQKFINNLKQRYQLYNRASGVSELSTVKDYFLKFPLVIG
tara:strand:+ start:7282 stop:8253 length:972 start_codon:yes stop_codon:yes gene_type:complete